MEAEKRGLFNLKTTADALPAYVAQKNVDLFVKHGIYTHGEVEARFEIHLENYINVISIEATTLVEMLRRDILPAVSAYGTDLCERADSKSAMKVACRYETTAAAKVADLTDALMDACETLESDLASIPSGSTAAMVFCHETIIPHMVAAREACDKLETLTASEFWPYPCYSDLLFYV